MCFLSNDIYDYFNVSQGKVTIPNVDDGEECTLTDVSFNHPKNLYPSVLSVTNASSVCESTLFQDWRKLSETVLR